MLNRAGNVLTTLGVFALLIALPDLVYADVTIVLTDPSGTSSSRTVDSGASIAAGPDTTVQVVVDGQVIDPSTITRTVLPPDVVLTLPDGQIVTLTGFTDLTGSPVGGLAGADGTVAIASSLEALSAPAASGGFAAGGGELFGLVAVISWILDRTDLISKAYAASPEEVKVESLELAQLLAQFRIIRETAVLNSAKDYKDASYVLTKLVIARLDAGWGDEADGVQANAVHVEAQIEVEEADFRRLLMIDEYEFVYGERIQEITYPEWRSPPPDDFGILESKVSSNESVPLLRNWRQRKFAKETTALLAQLETLAIDIKDAYLRGFDVGNRTLLEVLGAERVLFQTQVRLAQRTYDLRAAEAWLLTADDELMEKYLRKPGRP